MLPRKITPAESTKMFGPVYHGTSEDRQEVIKQKGFEVFKGAPRTSDVSNGYLFQAYGNTPYPPPIHHLGYGTYFTKSKTIAKNYNMGKGKLTPYYIDGNIETINFGSPNTMMKWWLQNGYKVPTFVELSKMSNDESMSKWQEGTDKLTKQISSKWDAVYFKGKGIRTLLDGDQICVYNPEAICVVDTSIWEGYDIGNGVFVNPGDRVKLLGTPSCAIFQGYRGRQQNSMLDSILSVLTKRQNNYFITLSNITNLEVFINYWKPLYRQVLEREYDKIELMRSRASNMQVGREENINRYVDYLFSKGSLQHNAPSCFIERVMKKRELCK